MTSDLPLVLEVTLENKMTFAFLSMSTSENYVYIHEFYWKLLYFCRKECLQKYVYIRKSMSTFKKYVYINQYLSEIGTIDCRHCDSVSTVFRDSKGTQTFIAYFSVITPTSRKS